MKNLSLPLSLIIATIFLFGCKQRVDVNVFVVTKGAENVKLGLVEVGALKKEEAIQSLRQFIEKREERIKKLKTEIETKSVAAAESSKRYWAAHDEKEKAERARDSAAKSIYRTIFAAHERCNSYLKEVRIKVTDEKTFDNFEKKVSADRNGLVNFEFRGEESYKIDFADISMLHEDILKYKEIFSHDFWAGMSTERDAALKAIQDFIDADANASKAGQACAASFSTNESDALSKAKEELTEVLKIAHLFENLPNPVLTAKTNADGVCSLELPSSGKWIVAASAQRMVGDKMERYFWLVEVPDGKSSGTPLFLSNDNCLNENESPSWVK